MLPSGPKPAVCARETILLEFGVTVNVNHVINVTFVN